MDDALLQQLVRHEGLRLFPYTDSVGKLTIGVGRNLTDVGITRAEAFTLLEHDVVTAQADLETFAWFVGLTPIRQRALIDMRFNLGPGGFRRFRALIAALTARDYARAAAAMLDSTWAGQVGGRASRLAGMMTTGVAGTRTV
jgi:lysozyme